MTYSWIHESPARWDAAKARVVGGASPGVFDTRYGRCAEGDLLPGDWWRVEDRGRVVAFGWLDVIWGDAEILLATDVEVRGRGIGTFVLDRLEEEARRRGLNYVYNLVRPTHPDAAAVTGWLEARGFVPERDGRLVRAVRAA